MQVEGEAHEVRERNFWIAGLGWFGALVIALTAGLLLSSCGEQNRSTDQASSPSQTVVAIPAGHTPATSASAPVVTSSVALESKPVVSSGAAPDIAVSVTDTLVMLGQTVEFVVDATPDVSEIALSDGHGDTRALVRDANSNVWRVTYRVPLRSRLERYGVSLTARTDGHRWRRVWTFLHIDSPAPVDKSQSVPEKEPGSDS
ncbi:MAG: hypothetical protein HOP12_14845 [Candidatus Eisenbacteria bacterium]|uniref:Uncharacterized protein n=1 Tax=Eiseniibacteriota bacterium TaxID=2212470 RepID=A0A849SVM9_UNCEI|nr:hypothetical protein [Candidatus Eisenbacteria bacterium]